MNTNKVLLTFPPHTFRIDEGLQIVTPVMSKAAMMVIMVMMNAMMN